MTVKSPSVLFLCTGNYYRSRFAEYYFRHLAGDQQLDWRADSRGLALDAWNPGPMSQHTLDLCRTMGIPVELRLPRSLSEEDLRQAALVIAVKETEHRPLLRKQFPDWEQQVEYWEVHDLDVDPPAVALPQLVQHVGELVRRLKG